MRTDAAIYAGACFKLRLKDEGFGSRPFLLQVCFRLRDTMMRRLVLLAMIGLGVPCSVGAQGTKLWSVDRYDAMEKGSTDGAAIRSDGRLEAGPMTSLLYTTGGNYVWSVASDTAGNAYVGMGGTAAGSAAVMKVAPDGKAVKVFEGKELGVQAIRVGVDGSVFAATSPDGKVYRVSANGGSPTSATVVFDAALTEEKPKYLWDLAVGRGGEVYVAAGGPAVVYRVPAGGGKAEVVFKTVDQHIRCLMLGPDGTLWAGSDGAGVIYRISTTVAGAKPFAVYAASTAGDHGSGYGWRGECVCGGSGEQGDGGVASAAGDGECGGDYYVLPAGVGFGCGGEYAGAGGERDIQDRCGWGSVEAGDPEG